MQIKIDTYSGFCFGVKRAIDNASELLSQGKKLYCLGQIVHNNEEENRLNQLGMITVSHEKIEKLTGQTILIRSHGEPPTTYTKLKKNRNRIIDSTCPVVLKLQQRIKQSFETLQKKNGQLVIYGKKGHPETIGLNGQTNNNAIIITNKEDISNIDFNRPIELYCQTTMSLDVFNKLNTIISKKTKNTYIAHDTICRQVANRVPHIKEFATQYDIIIFVSGPKSSNGKYLFDICKQQNPDSYFISSPEEIQFRWFENKNNLGICGATSTPQWLMEKIKQHILNTI